jgi:hypothetical protein
MRKGRYSLLELLLHIDHDKGIKYVTNKLGLELDVELQNLLFDVFEEVMFLDKSTFYFDLKNGDKFEINLVKADKKLIECEFYKTHKNSSRERLSKNTIIIGHFLNTGQKNVIDTIVGLRDLSNEINRLLNEFVDQNNLSSIIYNPSY